MIEHKVEVDRTLSLLLIDGVPYVSKKLTQEKKDGVTHVRKIIYRRASKQEINNLLKKIVDKLSPKTSKEELLKQLLLDKGMITLREIGNQIDKGVEIKKHKGCLGFKIGKKYLQLLR